jgi:8-oxo-dGTP pyrophosphatase MutT (NUDIX family)
VTDPRTAGLLRLLRLHRPADDEEAAHLRRMVALVETSPCPFDRDAFSPGHITASGFVLDPQRRAVALVHHGRLGIWIQPGGHVDPTDPDLDGAARREIAEEIGLTGLRAAGPGVLDVDVHRYPARPGGDPAHEHHDVRFGYLAPTRILRPSSEVRDARWVPVADLERLGVDRSILRPVATLLDLLT